MKTLLLGTVEDRPFSVVVPDDWTGRVSVVVNVHKGSASRRVQIVKEESHDLLGPAPDQRD